MKSAGVHKLVVQATFYCESSNDCDIPWTVGWTTLGLSLHPLRSYSCTVSFGALQL